MRESLRIDRFIRICHIHMYGFSMHATGALYACHEVRFGWSPVGRERAALGLNSPGPALHAISYV